MYSLLHADSRLALTQFLEAGDRAKSVVITHHAPSINSLPARKHADLITAAYASHLDEFIIERGPALWIHSHIHEARDYMIGRTRILNNAHGYPIPGKAGKSGFNPELIAEL